MDLGLDTLYIYTVAHAIRSCTKYLQANIKRTLQKENKRTQKKKKIDNKQKPIADRSGQDTERSIS